ncbi:laminin subunit beta-1-like [Mercenaria mercenaria]|uniref:laminin subunit beta-1-like n=1 Tax=Mercenaria mercenaria TaxID=6596 RepID=UPI00234F44C2|nr:laminin subunit beta-1-like [Mercenaria mercenaria]
MRRGTWGSPPKSEAGKNFDSILGYCVAGKFLNGQTCESCARGYYKDNDGNTRFDNCTKCPLKDGKETTTDDLGSDDQEACSVYNCAAGSISSENGCKECEMNTFQPKEFPFSTDTCLPCPVKAGLITNTRTTGTEKSADCLRKFPLTSYIEST